MLRLQRRGALALLHVTRLKTVPLTAGADLRGSPRPFGVQIFLFLRVECLKSNSKNLAAGMIRVRPHFCRAPSPTTRCASASSRHTPENGSREGRSRSPRVSGTPADAFWSSKLFILFGWMCKVERKEPSCRYDSRSVAYSSRSVSNDAVYLRFFMSHGRQRFP